MTVQTTFAQSIDDLGGLEDVLREYLTWDIDQLRKISGIDIDPEAYVKNTFDEIEHYFPPNGRLLLMRDDDTLIGIGFLKSVREKTCEIKRMYILPSHRGMRLGKTILGTLIQSAKDIGYSNILLDSAVYMKTAHAMYRAAGFKNIEYYPEGETDAALKDFLMYMELRI